MNVAHFTATASTLILAECSALLRVDRVEPCFDPGEELQAAGRIHRLISLGLGIDDAEDDDGVPDLEGDDDDDDAGSDDGEGTMEEVD